jgi:hypothetical protein
MPVREEDARGAGGRCPDELREQMQRDAGHEPLRPDVGEGAQRGALDDRIQLQE